MKIYSIGTFDFKTSSAIKMHEETFNIQNKSQTIQLLSKLALQEFLKKGFHYIHFGLIQIAIKPLVHTGLDIPVYTALRDKRLKRYKSSILSMIQTNIPDGTQGTGQMCSNKWRRYSLRNVTKNGDEQ